MTEWQSAGELPDHLRRLHGAQRRAVRAEREREAEELVEDDRGRVWGPRRRKVNRDGRRSNDHG